MFKDKTILLTGGTGSFGQKFVEIALKRYRPGVIRIFSRDELKQWEMEKNFNNKHLRFLIGDIKDKERVARAMDGVNIVIHAAALKQVPACEYNPFEAIKTNILGTQNIIEEAINHNIEKVMAISTDKAVNPINLYGATKMCMEKLIVAANSYAGVKRQTRMSCTRYGNVVGSRGSIIPLLEKQKKSGTITVTDKRMTRFWLTLEQGVEFVIKSVKEMIGGEIFVPKIPSMKIINLVNAITSECQIKYIGIRPGEKIHECLITEDEAKHTFAFKGFYVIEPEFPFWRKEKEKKWKKVKSLPKNFRYTSDKNNKWLTTKNLKKILKKP